MAVQVRVKLNLSGVNALMRSTPVQNEVDRVGQAMVGDAGGGFEYSGGKPHRWTARGFVQVASPSGARRQARDAVLERVASARR